MWRTVVMGLGCLAVATGAGVQGSATSVATASVTVPMLDYGGRPVVEVSVNGKGPFRMIVDTGASFTVVNPEWIGGQTGPTELAEFRIGSLAWTQLQAGSQKIFGGTAPPDMPTGVLSAAAFPGYLVTLDYPAKTISIRPGALPAADGKRIFQYGADEVLPVAPLRVAGREFHLHVDSGSPGGVMLPLHVSTELPLSSELKPAGRARTVAGEFDVFSAAVTGAITLGEYAVDVPEVRFSDLRPGPTPGPGNVGYLVLRTFKVTLDAANRRLLFER